MRKHVIVLRAKSLFAASGGPHLHASGLHAHRYRVKAGISTVPPGNNSVLQAFH